ncbi:MAG: tetratricopeptide repeat protein, partial [Candidatus Solibacter sp.]
GTVPPQPAAATKEAEKQAAHYERMMATLNAGIDERRAMLHQANKDAVREPDSMERRVARQVIAGVSMGDLDMSRQYMAEKRYDNAARLAEEALLARPDNANAWYTLAVASAAAGNIKRGLEALEQAVQKGFRNWDRVEAEPLLAKLRKDPRYAALMAKLRG